MPIPELQQQLDSVQQKLKQLLDKHVSLQKEIHNLRTEQLLLQKQLQAKEEEMVQLRQQNDVLKSGIQSWNTEEKKQFVQRIDLYLREIEKCLALINE